MALISLNLHPSSEQLRDFGGIALCMTNIIGLGLLWVGKIGLRGLVVCCLTGVVLYLLSRIRPVLLKPIYIALMLAGFPVGWLVSRVVLAFFYFGILTPLGLLFRLLHRDPLHLGWQPDVSSYWQVCRKPRAAKDYFQQF
ncbi:MAG: hypothetical protein K6E31_05180 [bacterium]|nr:hypothetical protein [bacterium]